MSSIRSASSITSSLQSLSMILPRLEQVHQPARRRDQHVDALFQRLDLVAHLNAADQQRHRERVVLAVFLEILGDLHRQLARRLEDQRARHARAAAALVRGCRSSAGRSRRSCRCRSGRCRSGPCPSGPTGSRRAGSASARHSRCRRRRGAIRRKGRDRQKSFKYPEDRVEPRLLRPVRLQRQRLCGRVRLVKECGRAPADPSANWRELGLELLESLDRAASAHARVDRVAAARRAGRPAAEDRSRRRNRARGSPRRTCARTRRAVGEDEVDLFGPDRSAPRIAPAGMHSGPCARSSRSAAASGAAGPGRA